MTTEEITIKVLIGLYYVLIAGLTLMSCFTVYIMIRYGRTVPLTVAISLLYAFFFLTVLNDSYNIAQSL